jgi:hypothetical protein
VTHFRTLFDAGAYLGSWHLPQKKDAIVTIESVSGGTLGTGAAKTRKPIVTLQGKALKLALNKTNAKTIAKLYGPDIDAWVGKRIALYVGETRDPDGGGQIACIRIRPSKPTGAASGEINEAAPTPERDPEVAP